MEKEYTLSVLAENQVGLTNRVTAILAKRKINIENLSGTETENKNVYRLIIDVKTREEIIENVILQIEKQIDVVKAVAYNENELIRRETAIYKLPSAEYEKSKDIEQLIKQYDAKIIINESDYIIVEKTGDKKEVQELLDKFKSFGILDFARSGRITIKHTKTEELK
ncbi:MAG: acetolactate synthase small subunit [Bacteroidales bacterium]|nr:acetolactate synthase small subunit [Bacteroidales bacterium]